MSLGFMREFKNSNVTADTTQFLGDMNTLWVPGITRDSSFSGWTTSCFAEPGSSVRDLRSCFLHRPWDSYSGWGIGRASRTRNSIAS